jgi:hypothetical protein
MLDYNDILTRKRIIVIGLYSRSLRDLYVEETEDHHGVWLLTKIISDSQHAILLQKVRKEQFHRVFNFKRGLLQYFFAERVHC